jgi:hypothetical protein
LAGEILQPARHRWEIAGHYGIFLFVSGNSAQPRRNKRCPAAEMTGPKTPRTTQPDGPVFLMP